MFNHYELTCIFMTIYSLNGLSNAYTAANVCTRIWGVNIIVT